MNSIRPRGRGFISLMVALVIFIPIFPSTLNADISISEEQIVNSSGGIMYYDSNGKEITASQPVLGQNNAVVSVNKTVRGTETENEFSVDLEVKTPVDISKVNLSADAALVLVLDRSGSAEDDTGNREKAAKEFLKNFAMVEGNGTSARYVALVTWASDTAIESGWADITNPVNMKNVTDKIDGIDWSDQTSSQTSSQTSNQTSDQTFIQESLLIAQNLLKDDVVPKVNDEPLGNRSVILFSEGKVQLYTMGHGSESYHKPTLNVDSLDSAFAEITANIERRSQAWVVTDRMGSNIRFMDRVAPDNFSRGILEFDDTTQTLSWHLKKDSCDLNDKIYTYKCSYRIQLDNTASAFVPNTAYETSGETVLDYVMVENNQTVGEILNAKFFVPKVPISQGAKYTLPTGQWAIEEDQKGESAAVAALDDKGQLSPVFSMPQTGGTGIAIFIGIGSLLLILGSVLFVIKQQRNCAKIGAASERRWSVKS